MTTAAPAALDPAKNEQVEALKYINRLATMTGTPIQTWNLLQVFGTGGEDNKLIVDKGEINRRFFEYKQLAPKPDTQALEVYKDQIKKIGDKLIDFQIENLNYILREGKKRIQDYYKQIENQTKSMAQTHVQLKGFELAKEQGGYVDEVRKIVDKGFWQLWRVTDRCIEFVTANELTLEHKNAKAGIDLQMNFGRFRIAYDVGNTTMTCYPHHNNLGDTQRCHPHIFADGRICWGGASTMSSLARSEGRLADAMDLLSSVLTNHNPDDPTYALTNFDPKKRWNTQEPTPPWANKPAVQANADDAAELHVDTTCEDCGRDLDDCSCEEAHF
jgi:hypothetical protein